MQQSPILCTKLQKKLPQNEYSFLFNKITSSQIKAAKQVYNLQNRNIKKFINQSRQMWRKANMIDSIKKNSVNKNNKGKKYEQNQLLQLQFKVNPDQYNNKMSNLKQSTQIQQNIKCQTSKVQKYNKQKILSNKIKLRFSNKSINNDRESENKSRLFISSPPNLLPSIKQHKSRLSQLASDQVRKKSQTMIQSSLIRSFTSQNNLIYLANSQNQRQKNNNSLLQIRSRNNSLISKQNYSCLSKSKRSINNKNILIQQQQDYSIVQNNLSTLSKNKLNNNLSKQTKKVRLILINQQKNNKYIKALHILLNGKYQLDNQIDQYKLDNLIRKRYSQVQINSQNCNIMKKYINKNKNKNGNNYKDTNRLNSLNSLNRVIQNLNLNTLHNKSQIILSNQLCSPLIFPFAQFITYPQTCRSINRIINLSIKSTHKIVFSLLDYNKNNLIDENDMIKIIQIAQYLPAVQLDFMKIIKYNQQKQSQSIKKTSKINIKSRINTMNNLQSVNLLQLSNGSRYSKVSKSTKNIKNKKINNCNTYSISQLSQIQSITCNHHKSNNNIASSFKKQSHFNFHQTKTNLLKPIKNNQNYKFSINLTQFNQIFKNQRPSIFYDLLQYLFKISSNDLIDPTLLNQLQQQQQNFKLKYYKQNQQENPEEFKNYNVPQIINDLQKKFKSNIQKVNYTQIKGK